MYVSFHSALKWLILDRFFHFKNSFQFFTRILQVLATFVQFCTVFRFYDHFGVFLMDTFNAIFKPLSATF